MKTSIDQAVLLRELSLLQGVIEKKSTIPILGNVLVKANEKGTIGLEATDLEVGYRSEIPAASVDRPGRMTVSARRLLEIVKRLPPGTVSIREDGGALHIESERYRAKIGTMDAEQFPTLRTREGNPHATINAQHLAEAIGMVFFATTTEDPRYSLAGALWEINDDRLTMVATDGHRLSIASRPAQKMAKEFPSLLVPRNALKEIKSLASGFEGDVYLWAAPGSLLVMVGDREVTTSLQEEKRFPDYRRVVPQNNDKVVEIETAVLRGAIDRVAILRDEDTKLIKLDLQPEVLAVSATNDKLGETAMQEVAVGYNGAPLAIGFNGQYLLEYLAAVGTDKVKLSLGEVMGQGLLEPVRTEGDVRDDRYVVMPMAL